MAQKRLFIGTFFNNSVILDHYDKIKQDFEKGIQGKWVEPHNLHMTYKFLGNVDEEKIPDVQEALKEVLIEYESKVNFTGINSFPPQKKPNTLFVKMFTEGREMIDAFKFIEKVATEDFKFKKERDKFIPHVTLCRVKESHPPKFKALMSRYFRYPMGSEEKFSIKLIQSVLNHEGPTYTVID